LAGYAARQPDAELFFLIGMDAARTLPAWREPRRLAGLARLVLLARAASADDDGRADREEIVRQVTEISGSLAPPIVLSTRRIDISSTEIRERVSSGTSIRGFVTDDVARYIATSGLYR